MWKSFMLICNQAPEHQVVSKVADVSATFLCPISPSYSLSSSPRRCYLGSLWCCGQSVLS